MRSFIVQSWTHRCLFVQSWGDVTAKDWRDLIHMVMKLDMFEIGFPVLHDIRQGVFTRSSDEMVSAGRTEPPPSGAGLVRRVANVVSTEDGFGMTGIVARLRDRPWHKTRVFRGMAEAADWLGRPDLAEGFPESIMALLSDSVSCGNRTVVLMKEGVPHGTARS